MTSTSASASAATGGAAPTESVRAPPKSLIVVALKEWPYNNYPLQRKQSNNNKRRKKNKKTENKAKHHLCFKLHSNISTLYSKALCGKLFSQLAISDFKIMETFEIIGVIANDKDDRICNRCCRQFFDYYLPATWSGGGANVVFD
jgi:hypothetical protein